MEVEGKRGAKGKTLFVTGLILYMVGMAVVAHYEPMNELRPLVNDGQNDTWDTTIGMMLMGGGTVVAGLGMTIGGALMLSATERDWRWPKR